MVPSDITSELTFAELLRIVDQNSEPWTTTAQCDLFLRAAGMLRRRVPEESELGGERLVMRDLEDQIKQCRKERSILAIFSDTYTPVVIVPPDDLR